MKNYFALYRVISVESGAVNAVDFEGNPITIEFDPATSTREAMSVRYKVDSIRTLKAHKTYAELPDEQPPFEQQLAQAGWTATPEQIAEWNHKAEEFFQNSLPPEAETADAMKRCTCDNQSCPHVIGRCKLPASHFDIWMDCVTDNLCDTCMQMHCQRLLSNADALRRCAVGFLTYPN